MAGVKQTPRQQMIGMMYLVLLAMLAMNASKDLLDAFIFLEGGIDITTKNFNATNNSIYSKITTAAAFLAFSRIDSDLVLLETGLGGKYDATNIIQSSLCSIITPISMDHMNFLGTDLLKIASEKIGILKKKSIIVLSKQKKSVRQLIRNEVKKKKALPLAGNQNIAFDQLEIFQRQKSRK